MSKRALLTGATGFIGARLAQRLQHDGWWVGALLRAASDPGRLPPGTVPLRHDGTLPALEAAVAAARPNVVFHVASLFLSEHRPDEIASLVEANVALPAMLVGAMGQAGCRRLVNVGTSWQNSSADRYRPVNLYAATKQAFEDLLAFYGDAEGLSHVTVRLFDTYGPADPRRKIVATLMEAARFGRPVALSPGEQVLDLVHVDDVVEGLVQADRRLAEARRPLNEWWFLSGERHSLRAIAGMIAAAAGAPNPARFGERPYRAREVMVPPEVRPDRLLPGWQRQSSFEDFLRASFAS